MEETEVSNIDSMVISLLNQDRDSFSNAFTDAMKERISGKLDDMTQEVSKELLSMEEGWADKAISIAAKAGKSIAKRGAKFAADNPNAMKVGKKVGGFAKQVAADPNVKQAAASSMKGTVSSAVKGAVSGRVPTTKSGESGLGAAVGKAAVGAIGSAWKKKREFQKAKRTGQNPPLKLASSFEPDNNELIEMNYTFDSPRTAKKFMTSATQAGINKRDLSTKGKTVTVGSIKDKDMKEMIRYLAKEMKATMKESLIPALQLAVYTDETVIVEAKNGIDIHITPKEASMISSIHDSLNEDNQDTMRNLMVESEEEYEKILNFCKEQFIEEESNHVN